MRAMARRVGLPLEFPRRRPGVVLGDALGQSRQGGEGRNVVVAEDLIGLRRTTLQGHQLLPDGPSAK